MFLITDINTGPVSGIKLSAGPLTLASAAILYHKFFKEADASDYDRFVSTAN